VTSGPQARFVRDVLTARGVTASGAPIGPTDQFAIGAPVFLLCNVQGVTPGTSHRLTIRWYLQGEPARMDGAYAYATVTHNGSLNFSVMYPAAGAGEVRLYWDEPVADNSDRPNASFLAATTCSQSSESDRRALEARQEEIRIDKNKSEKWLPSR
jgi:hypothetical protein